MQKLDKLDINSMTADELQAFLVMNHIPKYRSKQIFRWLHKHVVSEFTQMHNLPDDLICFLEHSCKITKIQPKQEQISRDKTRKYLFQLEDDKTIETVLIPERRRKTICVSSQVGCGMGCTFCATGLQGFTRNLTAGEIAKQVEFIQHKQGNVTNVVFMGMGEPLNNYTPVMNSIAIMNHSDGISLGLRRFTISTCGIVPKIRQLANDNTQVGLAVSLHAANDRKRRLIMPAAEVYSIDMLMDSCRYYAERTNRRITFEYALIADFNDTLADCRELVELLKDVNCHVNIIPINPVVQKYQRSQQSRIKAFVDYLNKNRIQASVRKERGTDIEAACGQLKQSTREDYDEYS